MSQESPLEKLKLADVLKFVKHEEDSKEMLQKCIDAAKKPVESLTMFDIRKAMEKLALENADFETVNGVMNLSHVLALAIKKHKAKSNIEEGRTMFTQLQALLAEKEKKSDDEMEIDFEVSPEGGEAEESEAEEGESASDEAAEKLGKADIIKLLKDMSPEDREYIHDKLMAMVEKDKEEAEPIKEGEDVWSFIVGEDGDTRKTSGDAAKVIKKMLSTMASDIRATGDDEMTAKWKKMKPQLETMTDPAALYKKLIKSDLAWDGYALELLRNGKTISQPSVTRY